MFVLFIQSCINYTQTCLFLVCFNGSDDFPPETLISSKDSILHLSPVDGF